jgi:hypothetical protein
MSNQCYQDVVLDGRDFKNADVVLETFSDFNAAVRRAFQEAWKEISEGKQTVVVQGQAMPLFQAMEQISFPVGTIILCSSMSVAAELMKQGWAICDGSNGTPDYRKKFIRVGGAGDAGKTGGTECHTHDWDLDDHVVCFCDHTIANHTVTAGDHQLGICNHTISCHSVTECYADCYTTTCCGSGVDVACRFHKHTVSVAGHDTLTHSLSPCSLSHSFCPLTHANLAHVLDEENSVLDHDGDIYASPHLPPYVDLLLLMKVKP